MSNILAATWAVIRTEPVRTAAFVIAAVIVTVSLITGVPVSAILVYLASAAAALEVARAAVGRLISEALHTPAPGGIDEQVEALDAEQVAVTLTPVTPADEQLPTYED